MPPVKRITVPNATFQQYEALLHNRRKRSRTGLFLVEGVRAVNEALATGWPLHAVVFSAGVRSHWAEEIIARLEHLERYELSPELMEQLSDKDDPSELILVAHMRDAAVRDIALGENALAVVMDRPGNPGNLGSILRSCDAFGSDVVALTGHGADLFDPQTVRASVGTVFSRPVVRAQSHRVVAQLRDRMGARAQVVGTSAKGEVALAEVDFTRPTVLVMGNESTGMSENYRALCDVVASIPIAGSASSLNVACATSVCLYEIVRQRSLPGQD